MLKVQMLDWLCTAHVALTTIYTTFESNGVNFQWQGQHPGSASGALLFQQVERANLINCGVDSSRELSFVPWPCEGRQF